MNDKKKKMAEVGNAVGLVAEMSLMYFRAVLGAGATVEEATKLTQAYIATMIFGSGQSNMEDTNG